MTETCSAKTSYRIDINTTRRLWSSVSRSLEQWKILLTLHRQATCSTLFASTNWIPFDLPSEKVVTRPLNSGTLSDTTSDNSVSCMVQDSVGAFIA